MAMRAYIKFICVVFVLAGLLSFSGCASGKAYKKGVKLLDAGQYEAAVESIEFSIELARPKKLKTPVRQIAEDYRLHGIATGTKKIDKKIPSLIKALKGAADVNYRWAVNANSRKQLRDACGWLDRALSYIPDHQESLDLYDDLAQEIYKAKDIQKQALAYMENDKWKEALASISEALKIDITLVDGKRDLSLIKDGGYKWYCFLADAALEIDARSEVENMLTQAKLFKASGPEIDSLQETLLNRGESDELVSSGKIDYQNKEYQSSLDKFLKASRLYPQKAEIKVLVRDARERICEGYIASADNMFQAGEYCDALKYYNKSKSVLSDYGQIGQYISKTRGVLYKKHMEISDICSQQSLYGNAVLHDLLSLNYKHDDYAARAKLGKDLVVLKKDIKYIMAFAGFSSAAQNREVSDMIEASALQQLITSKPDNMYIMDRDDLERALADVSVRMSDLYSADSAGKVRKLEGVDGVVSGKVLGNKVMMDSSSRIGYSTYQAGVIVVRNKAYGCAVSDLDTETRRWHHAIGELKKHRRREKTARDRYEEDPTGSNRSKLSRQRKKVREALDNSNRYHRRMESSRNLVARTPRTMVVADMRKHSYPIQEVSKTAKITCSIKMVDASSGQIVYTSQLEGEYTTSDRYIKQDEYHNVPSDPLDIPDDATMEEYALEDIIGEVRGAMKVLSKQHGQRFVIMANDAINNGNQEIAIENCMRYLLAYPGGGSSTSAVVKSVFGIIPEHRGLVDIKQLCWNYCRN